MTTLAIDIETYSGTDLTKCGVYKYVEDPDFTVLMIAYSRDGHPPLLIDFTDDGLHDYGYAKESVWFGSLCPQMRDTLLYDLTNPEIQKTAFNANFERTCLAKFFGVPMPPEQWECTMVRSATLGLPMSLDMVSKVLKLSEAKDKEGAALIRYFGMPCKPTKANGGRTRNLPGHDPEKWAKFCEYCRQDVVVEQAIREKLAEFPMLPSESRLWALDQKINDTGVMLDPAMIRNAIGMDEVYRERLMAEAKKLTGLDNPNSLAQLKGWLEDETGESIDKLRKDDVSGLLQSADSDSNAKRMLEIRQELGKTSVKKYAAMLKVIGAGCRARGIHQFGGAGRTMRWAGRLIQPQNLPQNKIPDIGLARQMVVENDIEMLTMLYGNVPDTLSQLIRTAFVAADGCRLIVADFAAIEARVIAWLAGEQWRLDTFAKKIDIYAASASQMFNIPVESIVYKDLLTGEKVQGPNYAMRQRGKVAELALGYQGGRNALETMGAYKYGLTKKELKPLVKAWRAANPAIVSLWYAVQDAAIAAVETKQPQTVAKGIVMYMQRGILFVRLPSGRCLSYFRAQLVRVQVVAIKYVQETENSEVGDVEYPPMAHARAAVLRGVAQYAGEPFYRKALKYEGMVQATHSWGLVDTYGGKLVENIVQAIARDCLAEALVAVDAAGYSVIMHVHDEIVCEVPGGTGSVAEVCEIMGRSVPWAPDLPLKAEGYETKYYKKD